MDSESNLDSMTAAWPPVPPATREAPEAVPGAGAAGVRKAIPRHHRSTLGGPIPVASTAAVAAVEATTAVPAVTTVTATTAGIFPHSWGGLRGTWRFSASSPHCKAEAGGLSRGA